METIFDILKQTKKDNCGQCGYPTCMAFAAAVHTGGCAKSACPYIKGATDQVKEPVQDPETALAKELKQKVKGLDLAQRAKGLGAQIVESEHGKALRLRYLGRDVYISSERVYSDDGTELETRDQILLYNYLFFGGKGDLSGEWVGLESFPNSISKVVTLKRYTEEKVARHFAGRPQMFLERCQAIDGVNVPDCQADACVTVPVLPKVPIQLHFWDEDKEDGFPAEVKALFDKRALDFLDIESLIFAAERLAETITQE
ncbi:MAG: DUF3786 domain-containing protein [Thermodesulfobacteria bacterium]|nr:DUF3786 domain-containing protein [Thermodesulfobacteriota bacterium]